MTTVRTTYRPKRAPRRKPQAGEIAIPTVVKSISRKAAKLEACARAHRPIPDDKP